MFPIVAEGFCTIIKTPTVSPALNCLAIFAIVIAATFISKDANPTSPFIFSGNAVYPKPPSTRLPCVSKPTFVASEVIVNNLPPTLSTNSCIVVTSISSTKETFLYIIFSCLGSITLFPVDSTVVPPEYGSDFKISISDSNISSPVLVFLAIVFNSSITSKSFFPKSEPNFILNLLAIFFIH